MAELLDNLTIAAQFDRLPPQSIESEMCLLASMMLDLDVCDECLALVNRQQFYSADHQILFDIITDRRKGGKPIDAVLMREELIRRQLLDEVGGVEYLAKILNAVPTAAHGVHYAALVAEKAKLREIIGLCNDALRDCYKPHDSDPADAIASQLEAAAAAVRDHGTADTIHSIEVIAHSVLNDLERRDFVDRIATGLNSLDDLIGGLPVAENIIIAGRAGMGKSQLAKQLAFNISRTDTPCGIITIEETEKKIGKNYLSGVAQIENSRLMYRKLTEEDWGRLPQAVGTLAKLPIYVDDAQQKLSKIQATASRMARKYGCKVIVVDHIHIVDAEGDSRMQREQELAKISGGLKFLWKKLGVAGVLCAQVNRQGGAEPDAAPELWHLRGSGSLEQDGDLIMQLLRPDYFRWKKDGDRFTPDHQLHVYVNKNKHGPVGMTTLYFDGDHQTISDWPQDTNGYGGFERDTF